MAYFIVESAETYDLGEKASFVSWLESKGFHGRVIGGHYGGSRHSPWLYIEIDEREFVYGVWGARAVSPVIGETHLTVDEFKSIYSIIQKSRGRMKQISRWQDRVQCNSDLEVPCGT